MEAAVTALNKSEDLLDRANIRENFGVCISKIFSVYSSTILLYSNSHPYYDSRCYDSPMHGSLLPVLVVVRGTEYGVHEYMPGRGAAAAHR